MAELKKYKVKNVSQEIFTEPWTNITLKPGEITEELEASIAQRLISVYPYRTQLLDNKGKSFTPTQKNQKDEAVAIRPLKKEEDTTVSVKNVEKENTHPEND